MNGRLISRLLILLPALFLSACGERVSHLEKILEAGVIRVVTRQSPTTYYIGEDGETGLEYELINSFSAGLGVEFEMLVIDNPADLPRLLLKDEADLAAAGLIRDTSDDEQLVFGPGYQEITKHVVYRNGDRRPRGLDDIYPHKLHLSAGMIQDAALEEYDQQYPYLEWEIHTDEATADLLGMVESGEILYAVAYSNEIGHARLLNPEIRVAFDISAKQPLSWLLKMDDDDDSLMQAVQQFHWKISDNGELDELIQQFYGPTSKFDYVDSRKFIDRYRRRLPELLPFFHEAAEEFDLDWRLLAAVSYQESHWEEDARSPTGVRGLMMLTQETAKQVGVSNRLDPQQSIWGGAKYLSGLAVRFPARIAEPDRTWLMLAAYNIGFRHLEDARVMTESKGGNPDLWENVRRYLPQLSKKKWYTRTRHGYARGYQAVTFVQNIRKYYSVLVQLAPEQAIPDEPLPEPRLIDSPAL
ncbi:MAG: membrane-bound lytic murein transglycosylase MltF [Gammaproteobacteria bacterium]